MNSSDLPEMLDKDCFERFKKTYGSLPFVCRFRDCPRGLDGFLTLKQREQHEAIHYRRWNCEDLKCPFYAKGWRSARALVQHNQMYHIKPQAFPSLEGENQTAKSSENKLATTENVQNNGSQPNKVFVCSGLLPSGETWGCGQDFESAAALKAHFRTTTGFECIRELYGETAGPIDKDDLQPRKRKYMFSNECLGTLESGAQWGCGKDFDTEDALFKHWQSNAGRECRKDLHGEVENKINVWENHESTRSFPITGFSGLTSFLSDTGNFQQKQLDPGRDAQNAEAHSFGGSSHLPKPESSNSDPNKKPRHELDLEVQNAIPQNFGHIKAMGLHSIEEVAETVPEPGLELPDLFETSFFDEALD